MIDCSDTRKSLAIEILNNELGIAPSEIFRFTNGYCHSVYYVKSESGECVLRVTGKENEKYYHGAVKWLGELSKLDIPVPKIIKHGQYKEVFYTLISFLQGKDLGDVYHALTHPQKREIAKELVAMGRKAADLPAYDGYGDSDSGSFKTWSDFLSSYVNRSYERIKRNGVFASEICETVAEVMSRFEDYFAEIKPTAFLDDITTKNVLIHNGKLSGIVDVDYICYGDALKVVGLTNMALLAMKADTVYIDYWLDEIDADETQRKAVTLYTLLTCIDFMSEQGMQFDNGNSVSANEKIVDLLKSIFSELLKELGQ